MDAKQTCGRRMIEYGPWERKENLDTWQADRWDRKDNRWNWPWKPRTCSFCGGIHPEDAIKLLKEGWEIETTGKSYKRYLEPPGYREAMTKIMRNVKARNLDSKDNPFENKETWCPTPPVKLYVAHFDQEERNLFNIELDKKKKKEKDNG